MMDKRYDDMNLLYTFDPDTPEDLCGILARDLRKRRLERGLSREALSKMSGVPVPTIAKFETKHMISLLQFVAIAKSLEYSDEIRAILKAPKFKTIEQLETINKNKNRKRGRNEFK